MPLIRTSHDADLAAITAIYAHHVLHGTGTFEIDPPSAADMAARRAEVLARRFSAEDSVYVADGARGMGLGRALLTALAAHAEAAGVRQLMAVIGDSANEGSIALHRSLGFTEVGVMHAVGWKHGAWRDIVLMQRPLGSGSATSPE